MTNARQERGLMIAAIAKIKQKDGAWVVPSQSGKEPYKVRVGEQPHCTCQDHETRGCKCKHIFAVEYVIQREENNDGTTTVTETLTISATKRKTYPQNWPAYNAAQTNEQDQFQVLLHDLCNGISNPPRGKGRPPLAMADVVFSATFKVYSTVSGRRFISDLRDAHEKGRVTKLIHYNSIFKYLEDEALTPILKGLIVESSKPLSSIESDFAVDSTGFTCSRYIRWYDHKYGAVAQQHDWVKAHFCTGVKTNVITAVEILDRNAADGAQLPALVETTANNFKMGEISGDKAYASLANFNVIDKVGATPYIPFKARHTGAIGGLFQKAFHYFNFKRDEFLAHYHKRSNVESTVSMIKAKFQDHVRSKTEVAMKNEVLCKILCHNICCLISAMYELGIDPKFGQAA